jgi:DNA-binding CsgD family transcriptional regulator
MHTTFLEAQADLVGELPGDEERLSLLRDLVVREPHVAIRGVISLLRRGLLDEARALYARLPAPDAWRPPQYVVTVQIAERIKAAIALQVADDVEQLLPRLEPLAKWQVAFGSGVHLTLGSGFLYTGMAAACLGELERAIADVSKAIEENARAGAVPLAVVARQELAEILERRGSGADLARARRIASEVMRDAEALGMRPALERSAALLRRIPRQMVRSEELSPRELEVAGLIRHGLTNRQVAMRLGISERTAENHVDHILRKLGFATRAQVAAWVVASERG